MSRNQRIGDPIRTQAPSLGSLDLNVASCRPVPGHGPVRPSSTDLASLSTRSPSSAVRRRLGCCSAAGRRHVGQALPQRRLLSSRPLGPRHRDSGPVPQRMAHEQRTGALGPSTGRRTRLGARQVRQEIAPRRMTSSGSTNPRPSPGGSFAFAVIGASPYEGQCTDDPDHTDADLDR
jgi:hypothetical protein